MERPRGEWGRAEPEKEGEICRDEEKLRREAASCWVGVGGTEGRKGVRGRIQRITRGGVPWSPLHRQVQVDFVFGVCECPCEPV